MKIRIVKASKPTYWYADKIGEVMDVKYIFESGYGINNIGKVEKKDCEEVIEHGGQLYRKVDREVIIGDKIMVTEYECQPVEAIANVIGIDEGEEAIYVDDEIAGCNVVYANDPEEDVYHVLELIESASPKTYPDAPTYATVSESIHNASKALNESNTGIEFNSDRVLDTLSNLAQEVAELKRNQEELIARMNDLDNGVEAAAFDLEAVINEFKERQVEADERFNYYIGRGDEDMAQFFDGKATGFKIAARRLEEALRNG